MFGGGKGDEVRDGERLSPPGGGLPPRPSSRRVVSHFVGACFASDGGFRLGAGLWRL